MSVSWALPFDEKVLAGGGVRSQAADEYLKEHRVTLQKGAAFWESVASELDWFEKWHAALDSSNPPFHKWFVGGKLNASYLCVDRQLALGRADKPAIVWEGEMWAPGLPSESRVLTYGELSREVNRAAKLLRDVYGIARGDTVGFYLPMIPEFPILMLAAARIGAKFTVVFSGFSAESLAERLEDAGARLLVTADGGMRRGAVIPLKETADKAVAAAPSVRSVIVVRRTGLQVPMKPGRDAFYEDVMSQIPDDAVVDPARMSSEDPLFILHTSGTTGRPKGQVHDTGGYLTLLHATMKWVFDISERDMYWCTADIGWITGHSYVVFGPLLEGATTLMYEGALDFPQPDKWASVIERHGVSVLYTSPTAIRSFMKNGEAWVAKHRTSSVRIMHSVGEPINPEAFRWMHRLVGRSSVPFGSTWWMTETGGIMISVLPGGTMVAMKPGSNGFPIPGVDIEVVDDSGRRSEALQRGLLVIRRPWPGMPLTIHNDPGRYKEVYWSRFPGFFYAGDYAVRDEDGYIWVLGRADEVIKVAGHRLGTYELESALVQHPAVAEAAVVGVPDEVRGEVPVGFVILKTGVERSESLKEALIRLVREKVGPVASLKDVIFVSRLPKTRSAKIMRRVVRAVLVGKPVGDISTIEDEASVEEVRGAYLELQQEVSSRKAGDQEDNGGSPPT
ncbi:MAG: acetate--CoA ligase [Thaumarchaeota archaeon]|nr:acetate--CoA ligase [Nitrososphaerota archaeon]